jgi:hypothetical protein
VIEALCAPARAIHDVYDVYDVYDRREEWCKKAFAVALPALLRRTTDPALRRRPLEQADDGQFADLADQGVVTDADLPAILRTHRPTPGLVTGLARHPGQVDDAIGLLRHLHDTDLERVVSEWNPRRYRADTEAFPPVPPALLDAVLEYALTPRARILDNLGEHPGWEISQRPGLGLPHEFGEGSPGASSPPAPNAGPNWSTVPRSARPCSISSWTTPKRSKTSTVRRRLPAAPSSCAASGATRKKTWSQGCRSTPVGWRPACLPCARRRWPACPSRA